MDFDYNIFIRNNQNKTNSFNFSYSCNNSSYTNASAGDYTSPQASGSSTWVVTNKIINLDGLGIKPKENFYTR